MSVNKRDGGMGPNRFIKKMFTMIKQAVFIIVIVNNNNKQGLPHLLLVQV